MRGEESKSPVPRGTFEESKSPLGNHQMSIKDQNIKVYQDRTQENEESTRRNDEIIAYIKSSRELHVKEIVKSIGYDSKNVEYYLFFGQKYQAVSQQERQIINNHIKTVLKFIAKRKRNWALIYFDQI